MDEQQLNNILASLYKELIGKSWQNPDGFEAYQDSWHVIEKHFNVAPFDWTEGEKPRIRIREI